MRINVNWQDPRLLTVIIALIIFAVGIYTGQIVTQFSYQVPLALFLTVLIVLVTLVNTDAGLAILIFSMLFSPEIITGALPGRDIVIRFDDILLAVITFTWLAKTAVNKGLALFVKTPLNNPIALYILICLIATLKGIAQGFVDPARGFFYVLRYIEYFLLFILVVNHIHSRKQIKFFLGAFFITCTLVSFYGLFQIPGGARVSAPFEGKIGEPNTFGGYLLFILCLAVGIALQNVSQRLKAALVGLSALIIFPFLYTLSRASYVAIIFSFIALIIFSKRKAVLITAVASVAVLVLVLRPEAVLSRVEYTFHEKEARLVRLGNTYLDQSSSARIQSWGDCYRAWKKNPILGRGITGIGFIDGQYIRTLPELGVVGFFAFLWLLWSIYKHSYEIYRKVDDELYKGLTLGFIAGFVGLAIHALTANTFIIIRIMEPFWFIAAMVIMLPKLEEAEPAITA